MSRDPFDSGLIALWIIALAAWLLCGAVFGLLLLGDEVGLWQFDSGLGCEKGDRTCSGA